jgi:Trk-type K+ transport systems, membrane components
MFVVLAYILTFSISTLIGSLFGYPLIQSAFEAASAVGNVGLSAGIVSAAMPNTLKITYIFSMWTGRLEFMSVLALVGYLVYGARKKWSR